MSFYKIRFLAVAGFAICGTFLLVRGLSAFQRPFRMFPGSAYEECGLPADWSEKTEWVFARLMYPPSAFGRRGGRGGFRGGGFGRFGDWTMGRSSWTTDYPCSDRHFTQAMRRLTRVHTRSAEQPVNVDEGDHYDWPWLYAVETGHWALTAAQAKALREYLLRGGFLMTDDFHGTMEWEVFAESMSQVFPDRPIVEIEGSDPVFHALYDLNDRYQVPGVQFVSSGRTYEQDGVDPHWRGIYDDKGRLMVAICFNMDLGDSWEHADNPRYPEKFSAAGIRTGINYVVYAMTH
jgi:hypothetical protein